MVISKRIVSAAVLFTLLAALPLSAQRQPPPSPRPGQPSAERQGPSAEPRPQGPGAGSLTRCLAILDLTESQQADIRAAVQSSAEEMRALHQQLRDDREAVRSAIDAGDACAIGSAVLKVEAGRQAIRSATELLRANVESFLTAEQKAKLAGCMEARRGPRRD
ncbi:MAG TPA: Spy/CpxP family protein refolding chaperone [Thermoanaerobaculia bacterium]|nr:Spy/CpxP family protein refolding chaperone [Thermoanaerobaculia bacterium]